MTEITGRRSHATMPDNELLVRAVTPELLNRARRAFADTCAITADTRAGCAQTRERIAECRLLLECDGQGGEPRPTTLERTAPTWHRQRPSAHN